MKDNKIKRIPYGLANYERLVQQNCYYVDKTMFLPALEETGHYLFLIRPRRFGKSLLLSVMEAYYDVHYRDRFEEFFKRTWIYDHPTSEKNKYLVLKFNFSLVDPGIEKSEESFLLDFKETSAAFLSRYKKYLEVDVILALKEINEMHSAPDILRRLINICNMSNREVYILIDEYDNFANTILTTSGTGAYKKLTHGAGSFRAFFNVLKGGTTGTEASVTRSFITGVSPITMDDVISGYNIGKNVSLEPGFNRVLGFTTDDIEEMIEYYRSVGKISHPTGYLLEIMTQWYGNYRFSDENDVSLFNPDMVLYFLDNYFSSEKIPYDLIDRNVMVDYGKLRHLIVVDKGGEKVSNGNFDRLREIIREGETTSELVKGFPLEKIASREDFISLLFYFGLLTIKNSETACFTLTIPNETIRRLFYDYIKGAYEETQVFSLDLDTYNRLMKGMALEGQWKPLLDYIAGRMRESMGLRDLMTGEKSIQAFLNVYLGLTNLYIIHPEREMNKGFADIVMEPFLARYEGIRYSYILEIKYLKSGVKPGDKKVPQLKTEAEQQLKGYSIDEKFKKTIEKTTLIKIVLIFSGHELIDMSEVK